ncbi:hypothetical protein FIV34_07250 [Luteibacter pinisoli]|uniref:Uncharacterized protein n=1 Tax=Luteibacter pinisoli TaxID=2589080 RepID=A0A4Y5Z333_9GAMM|nr:hypothetical protein [Luteibacter pinisoli]QDE39009.1 hypothetical protein FIV34_07250 [Luteibacter pinisoli]
MKKSSSLVVLAILCAFVDDCLGCRLGDARYRYTASKGPSVARFVARKGAERGDAAIALRIDVSKTTRLDRRARDQYLTVLYGLSEGKSQHINLQKLDDPHGSPRPKQRLQERDVDLSQVGKLYVWNLAHQSSAEVPVWGGSAPAYLFLPSLATALSNVDDVSFGEGVFELSGCEKN